MILKLIRYIVGNIIITLDLATRFRRIRRSPELQAQVENETKSMILYEFRLCPFCVRVRRNVHRLNIPMEFRDAKRNPKYRQELEAGGGKIQVPCLRIESGCEVVWMYESQDINTYLNERFGMVAG